MNVAVWRPMVLSVSHWSLSDRRGPLGAAMLWCAILGTIAVLTLTPLSTSAVMIAGACMVLLTFIRPAVGLALLALLIPIGPVREIAIGPASIGAAELWTLVVVSAWLARMMAFREVHIMGSRLWPALAVLLGAMAISLTQALSLGYALKELSKWLEFAAIILCAASLARANERRLITGAALLAGIGAGLLGWYQFLRGIGPEGFLLFGRFMRAYGTFRQPNPYAGYLGVILPMAVGLVISYWPWRRPYTWPDRALWLLALGAICVIGPAILMSWSRGAWFGVAAALLIMALARGPRFAFIMLTIALALAGVIVISGADRYVPATLVARLTDFTDYFTVGDVSNVKPNPANWAVVERMAHWQAALRMWNEHPWFGVGIGNYEPVYPAYRLPRWRDALGHAHNYYLNIAAECGIVGLAGYLAFWLTVAWLTLLALRRRQGVWRGMALGMLGVWAHVSIHNVFDNLYVQGIYLQLALWIGMILPLAHPGMEESST